MKFLTRHILILTVLTVGLYPSLSAQDTAKVLTLADCIRMGIDSATQVLYSQNTVAQNGISVLNAYGQFLPDLGFNSAYTFNGGKNLLTTGSPTLISSRQNILNYQLLTTVNIFNGLNDISALKSATASKSAAELNLSRAKQQIAFDITQSYLQLMLDRHIIIYAQQDLNASLAREAQLSALVDVGRRARSDLYQQQAQTSSDKLFMIDAVQKVKNDKIALLRKIRITQPDRYELAEVPKDSSELGTDYQNIEDLIHKATNQRPDYLATIDNIKAADWTIRQYQSGYYPKLNLFAGLISNGGYLNMLYVNGTDALTVPQQPLGQALFGQVYGTLGLNLSWKIFDKFITRHNVQYGRISRSNAEISRDDLSFQIASDIRQAYNDYVAALQQIETSRTGLIAANEAYNAVKGRYDIGSANFIEVSNAQAVLLQAGVNKEQAFIKLSLQKKVIDYLVGN